MIINKTNIKSLLGESNTTYDSMIDMLIPQLIDSIVSYSNNDFIMRNNYNNDYVYDDISMVFTSTTIALTTTIPISTGDFIRIYGTCYNDGIYQINAYYNGVITIESAKKMRSENISNAYIAIMDFPGEFLNIIAEHMKNTLLSDGNVKREKLDDSEIEYFANISADIVKNNASTLSKYRKVFKESIFGGDCNGII
jgi:hypothetical protein